MIFTRGFLQDEIVELDDVAEVFLLVLLFVVALW